MPRAESLNALYDRIRHIEAPAGHGVLPFDVPEIDRALPGGGLALGAVHEILGADGDEEDGAAAAGFIAGLLARLGPQGALRDRSDARTEVASASSVLRDAQLALRSRRGRRLEGALLSMTQGPDGIKATRHPEEAAKRPSRRTHSANQTDPWLSQNSRRTGLGLVLWCLKRPDLYGPGLAEHGLDPARLVLVVAKRDDEILWAMEEGLRASGLAAVVGEVGRLPMVAGRRLQLAAERSGITALLLRRWRNAEEAAAERERPSAALTRWRVGALPSIDAALQRNPLRPLFTNPLPLPGGEGGVRGANEAYPFPPSPQPSPPENGGRGRNDIGGRGFEKSGRGLGWGLGTPRWRVELLRCRGGAPAQWIVESGEVEVADATGHVSLSAALADRPAASPRREAAGLDIRPFRRAG